MARRQARWTGSDAFVIWRYVLRPAVTQPFDLHNKPWDRHNLVN